MAKLFEYKQKRAKLIHDQREILERADVAEVRALSSEDMAMVDKMATEVDTLDQLIEKLQALDVDAESIDEERDEEDAPVEKEADRKRSMRRGRPVPFENERTGKTSMVDSKEYRSLHKEWLRTGFFDADPRSYRDITMSPNSSGGYLATPTQISENIVQIINNLTFMRKLAKVTNLTSAQSLGVRQLTTQPSDATWSSEIGAVPIDTSMVFAQRPLTPQLLSKGINVSIRELELVPDVEDLVTDRLGYKFAVAEENAYLNGSGSGQPLGVFTASANGIPTTQDVVVSASGSTAILPDNLIAAKYAIKQPYLQGDSVAWVFSRLAVQQIRLMKDSYGRYLWVDGGGFNSAPDTILGIPVHISEYCPNAFTGGGRMSASSATSISTRLQMSGKCRFKDLWNSSLGQTRSGFWAKMDRRRTRTWRGVCPATVACVNNRSGITSTRGTVIETVPLSF